MTADLDQLRRWLRISTGQEVVGEGVWARDLNQRQAGGMLADALPDLLDELAAAQAQLAEAHRNYARLKEQRDGMVRREQARSLAAEARLEAVRAVAADIGSGEHATSGRQFGQGMAHASKLFRAALSAAPQPEPPRPSLVVSRVVDFRHLPMPGADVAAEHRGAAMTPRTEAELLACTIDLAERTGWAVHHDRPARRAGTSWATAISGHAGFPDLVLARRGVVLFRELKGYDKNGRMGRLSSEQRDWARQLGMRTAADKSPLDGTIGGFGPIEWRRDVLFDVWTPDDWHLIVATLTAKQPAATR